MSNTRNNLNRGRKVSVSNMRKKLNTGRGNISQLKTNHSTGGGGSREMDCSHCLPGEVCHPCMNPRPGSGPHRMPLMCCSPKRQTTYRYGGATNRMRGIQSSNVYRPTVGAGRKRNSGDDSTMAVPGGCPPGYFVCRRGIPGSGNVEQQGDIAHQNWYCCSKRDNSMIPL
jgi:hypothetical protein